MRRNSKENNFKAILETIRDVMNVAAIGNAVPGWLHDVFLGYGDAGAAHYKSLPTQLRSLNMCDTFVSGLHAETCFPGHEVVFQLEDGSPIPQEEVPRLLPPFKATFTPLPGGLAESAAPESVLQAQVACALEPPSLPPTITITPTLPRSGCGCCLFQAASLGSVWW
jgi:intron-binding protein aquarius